MSVSDYALGLVAVRQVHEQCREEENDRRDHDFEQCPYLAEFRRWVKADQDIAVIAATSGTSEVVFPPLPPPNISIMPPEYQEKMRKG